MSSETEYTFRENSSVGTSWGRYPRAEQAIKPLHWRTKRMLPELANGLTMLPYGQGRSYGDACLNNEGLLLDTSSFDRIVSFDEGTGVLEAEAGLTLQQLLQFAVPKGWFLPVSPGTQFVSLGGAVANDIHGKNHHRSGTFGCHVKGIELERSNGEIVRCSHESEHELFSATVAGLGLTGLMRTIKVQLKPITTPYFDVETIQFERVEEFFEIARSSDKEYEYTVAWIDCVNATPHIGRGLFMRGNHSEPRGANELKHVAKNGFLKVPFDFPSFALNRFTLGAFNTVYYNKQFSKVKSSRQHYRPFFYPLDAVYEWNRIYGKRGFLQFQCVVPSEKDFGTIKKILDRVIQYGKASFLAVIKEFGDISSPGMLSFPRPGVTLCLDFPMDGEVTLKLFRDLEELTVSSGGGLYPAKDACMSASSFQQFYPRWKEFSRFMDPNFSSSFWRRVSEDAQGSRSNGETSA